jgi:hypothetical protein
MPPSLVAILFSSDYLERMSITPATPHKPPPQLIELYRAAAVAYRRARRAGGMDYAGICAGRDAVKKLKPGLSDEEAMQIVTAAVSFAATHHQKWFWAR